MARSTSKFQSSHLFDAFATRLTSMSAAMAQCSGWEEIPGSCSLKSPPSTAGALHNSGAPSRVRACCFRTPGQIRTPPSRSSKRRYSDGSRRGSAVESKDKLTRPTTIRLRSSAFQRRKAIPWSAWRNERVAFIPGHGNTAPRCSRFLAYALHKREAWRSGNP